MMINPEFRKGVLTRFSKARVITPLLILLALWYACLGLDQLPAAACRPMLWLWLCACTLLGAVSAASSIRRELQSGTWEHLRISSLSPYSLGIGHLFGATSYAWYLKGLGTGVAWLVCPALFQHEDLMLTILVTVALMLAVESYVLTVGIMAAPAARQSRGRDFSSQPLLMMAPVLLFTASRVWILNLKLRIESWGGEFNAPWFWLFTAALALTLCLGGLFRAIRRELSLPVSPWYVLLVALILTSYCAPFVIPFPSDGDYLKALNQGLGIFSSVNLLIAYYSALLPRADYVTIARMALKSSSVLTTFRGSPPDWVVALLAALVSAVVLACVYPNAGASALFPLLMTLYCIRDLALIVYLDLTRSLRFGPNLRLLIVFMCIYLLLPGLFGKIGFESIAGFFAHFPQPSEISARSFILPAASAACANILAYRRARRIIGHS